MSPRRKIGYGWRPKLRRHKHGYGVVRLNGVDTYFGARGDWKAKGDPPPAHIYQAYRREVHAWENRGGQPATEPSLTVTGLVRRYLAQCEKKYRRPDEAGGTRPTSELSIVRAACRYLLDVASELEAQSFSRGRLKEYRNHLLASTIEDGPRKGGRLTRETINGYVRRVKQMFLWAAREDPPLVPVAVYDGLKVLAPLAEGEEGTIDNDPVQAPPLEHVEAVIVELRQPLADMVRVQMWTGMR